MSSVLDRSGLEQSPLADLHLLATELGVENFRRLRKADLIDAILARQTGTEVPDDADAEPDVEPEAAERPPKPRPTASEARRGPRPLAPRPPRRARARPLARRGRRQRRLRLGARAAGRSPGRSPRPRTRSPRASSTCSATGRGSCGSRRPSTTDEDVYVSAAQVKRCELVSGDRISGPVRAPRRSERFPSLIRVDTINGRPADEVAEGTRFEDLPAAFPSERFELGSEDPTVKAIEWLTPFGKGSRVTIAGAARSGKSEALRRLAAALAGREGIELTVVLAGVRPEEAAEWQDGPVAPAAALSFAASADAQAQAVEQAVEQGRRVAARGGDAVVLIDSLEYLGAGAARRALAAARNIAGGGSLTVVATAPEPVGGETTVVALDAALTAPRPASRRSTSPRSGTLRPELLVGEAGAEAIAKARAEAA